MVDAICSALKLDVAEAARESYTLVAGRAALGVCGVYRPASVNTVSTPV